MLYTGYTRQNQVAVLVCLRASTWTWNLKVLDIIYGKLKEADINWVITGSTAFAIQGITLEPNDIDIQTDEKGAYEIEKYFNEYVVKKVCFSSNEKVASHFGALEIDGLKVEIMEDLRKKLNDVWEEPVDFGQVQKICGSKWNEVACSWFGVWIPSIFKDGKKRKSGVY